MKAGGSTNPWILRALYAKAGAVSPTLYSTVEVNAVIQTENKQPVFTLSVEHPLHQYFSESLVSKNCAGSDYVTMEIIHIQDELKRKFHGDASIILHGHDAVYVECKESHAEQVANIVKHHFGATYVEGPAGPCYLTADIHIGKNLKEVK